MNSENIFKFLLLCKEIYLVLGEKQTTLLVQYYTDTISNLKVLIIKQGDTQELKKKIEGYYSLCKLREINAQPNLEYMPFFSHWAVKGLGKFIAAFQA